MHMTLQYPQYFHFICEIRAVLGKTVAGSSSIGALEFAEVMQLPLSNNW